MELDDTVVMITGAGSGIGAATAVALDRAGARVVAGDRDLAAVTETCASLDRAVPVGMDVTDEDQVAAAVDLAVRMFGQLDGAVNNAALPPDSHELVELDADQARRTLEVNVLGVSLCLKHQLRVMYARGAGSIVNLGSVRSFRPRRANAAYVASKHAVLGLTRVAALEAAEHGVRVNAVCPGAVETPMLAGFLAERGRTVADFTAEMSPLGRLGRPDDIVAAVAWLLSDRSSFVTGAAVPVDGGYTSL